MELKPVKSGFKLIRSETKDLTQELLEWFSKLEPSPTERPIDERRIRHLLAKAGRGELITFNWTIAKLGDKVFRTNGQHSVQMLLQLLQLNGQLPDGLKVHLDEYGVDDMAALALLFRQHDDRRSSRTSADVAGAYQMTVEPLREVKRPVAKLALEAATWYDRWIVGLPVPTGDDLFHLFNRAAYHAFIRWAGEMLRASPAKVRQPGVVAAMYGTFLVSERDATAFWSAVINPDEFDESSPAARLSAWLAMTSEERKEMNLKTLNFYAACAYAWAAHREDKTFTNLKYKANKNNVAAVHD